MPRLALLVEYDGRPFLGWQRQGNGQSVQAVLEEALFRFSGERIGVVGAGRTDTGVHATGQVAHLDLEREVDPGRLRAALNHYLRPQPVAVTEVRRVDERFHARFSAIGRAYRYRILTRRAPPTFDRGLVWHHPVPLDPEHMHDAAQVLIGYHDFSSFRATSCQARSPLKSLDLLHIHRDGEIVIVDVRARSFLHHQVRNIVGTLALIGSGKHPCGWMKDVLAARDRRLAGPTAPADGLTLVEVAYPSWSSRSSS
ncbi:MAG TPA: tRNA pseudouridine(38-40) synthase TruA [Geminicoccus sp.]|jgi:tRNA pseudouridine38-40 synthase|uniref:tRNA pseudouridine(38-40) synthase TruA n=1 Tax=Geminicoccus sp. TaxID=2024832 RepID=UPI002E3253A1|nr:tRNA pseudouridine(38-40) synthase TruA [Geminicoccus sp.]HEX2525082.1 tRNA pseudouridine(38-40) synthase TruA [Geminicoccus sp.]